MPPPHLQHRRTHNLLLISKLLSTRENASPFTLVIDSLEQSAKGLAREVVRRANVAKTKVVFVAFETLKKPRGVDVFIPASRVGLATLHKQVTEQISAPGSRNLLVIDTLHPLCSDPTTSLPGFLSSLLNPHTSLLAIYHADIPLPSSLLSPYTPHPLTLLKYLSTTIITTRSLSHVLAEKAARDKSLASPVFGLQEEREGVIVGLGSNDHRGIVLEMEHRRKSGRGVRETYFLPASPPAPPQPEGGPVRARQKESIILLEDHPLYRTVPAAGGPSEEAEQHDTTFNLGLTEKQRRDREGVVLPYFDAQREEGPGEGGRILYEMGEEDDFDEEEDEI